MVFTARGAGHYVTALDVTISQVSRDFVADLLVSQPVAPSLELSL